MRFSTARRSSRVVFDQVLNARRAAATALSTSALVPMDDRAGFFSGGIDHFAAHAAFAVDPFAVDVMLQQLAHVLNSRLLKSIASRFVGIAGTIFKDQMRIQVAD
jgi:hypothetical protein